MVLDDEQSARFFDTMDALLYFVNERFRVVEGFSLESVGAIDDMKAGLVARALWENVEVIDQFVTANPARLPKACLDLAASWKCALPGFYTLVRYQGGRALVMGPAGVFAVCGVTEELAGEIGPAPAYVEMVLLPFDDLIIYDGFLQAYDLGDAADERARIQDEFENRCAAGIVSSGSEFCQVAGDFLAKQREVEIDALLAEVAREAAQDEEVVPAGFHRGALAGLPSFEREAAIAAVLGERGASQGAFAGAVALPLLDGDAPGAGVPGAGAAVPPGGTGGRDRFAIQSDLAMNCAVASVLARGVVLLEEAYAQYRALSSDPLELDEFARLAREESLYPDAELGIWTYAGGDYLVHYTLTPDFLAQQASRGGWTGGGDWRGLPAELEYYESFKRELLEVRREVSPRPLSRALLEMSALGELLGDSTVMQLRAFLDERVPDGEDDYTFPDRVVSDIALASIETGSLAEVMKYVDDLGLSGCSAETGRLETLVANVFNAMPSWENNGWSPQELYEQLTGRKLFYNADGSVMRLGPDDACPCGSGRRYGECCGR